MPRLNFKFLAFYSLSIISVVVLFQVVTAYGKRHLKAPPPIGGSYHLKADNFPGCLKSDTLVLNIQQSGIYLFASLVPAKTSSQIETIAEEKPSLTGRLSNQQLILEGSIPWISNCHQPIAQFNNSGESSRVKIQGFVKGETLMGQITLNSIPTSAKFTAVGKTLKEQSENKH